MGNVLEIWIKLKSEIHNGKCIKHKGNKKSIHASLLFKVLVLAITKLPKTFRNVADTKPALCNPCKKAGNTEIAV